MKTKFEKISELNDRADAAMEALKNLQAIDLQGYSAKSFTTIARYIGFTEAALEHYLGQEEDENE